MQPPHRCYRRNFSNVRFLLKFLDKLTINLTFENFSLSPCLENSRLVEILRFRSIVGVSSKKKCEEIWLLRMSPSPACPTWPPFPPENLQKLTKFHSIVGEFSKLCGNLTLWEYLPASSWEYSAEWRIEVEILKSPLAPYCTPTKVIWFAEILPLRNGAMR